MKRLILFACLLLPASSAWANSVPIGRMPALEPLALFFDYVVDLFFILLVLALLRRTAALSRGRIAAVGLAAMSGGLIADAIGGVASRRLMGDHDNILSGLLRDYDSAGGWDTASFLVSVLIPVPIIFIVNYLLGRRFLGLSPRQGLLLGAVMGICTAPILGAAFEQLDRQWIGGELRFNVDFGRSPLRWVLSPLFFAWAAALFALADILLLSRFQPAKGKVYRRAWSLQCLALLALPAAYTIPLTAIHHQRVIIYECVSHLKRIAMAIWIYKEEAGEFPNDLESLPPKFLPDRRMLRCPIDPRGPGAVSYTYRKPPPDGGDRPAETIMLRCPHHADDGYVPVAYADGHTSVEGRYHRSNREMEE